MDDLPDVWTAFVAAFAPHPSWFVQSPPIIIYRESSGAIISRIIMFRREQTNDVWGLPNHFICPYCAAGPSFLKSHPLVPTMPDTSPISCHFECTRCLWMLPQQGFGPPPECHDVGHRNAYAYTYPPPEKLNSNYLCEQTGRWTVTPDGRQVWTKWLSTERGKAHCSRITALGSDQSMPEVSVELLAESDGLFQAWWRKTFKSKRQVKRMEKRRIRKRKKKAAVATT